MLSNVFDPTHAELVYILWFAYFSSSVCTKQMYWLFSLYLLIPITQYHDSVALISIAFGF